MKRLFMLLMLVHFNLWAQETTISGRVTDMYNETLNGVLVRIKQTGQKTVTGEDGTFSFNTTPATYDLEVKFKGYQTKVIKIDARKNVFVLIKLQLQTETLPTIVVSAVKATADMPVTQTNISQKKLQEENLGQDVPYLLELTPSVVVTSDAGAGIGYTGIRIRGISPQQINVSLNGVPLNDPESHSVYWVDIPDFAGNTQNLQIQRGVGTSGFGTGAFGAAVNLETDRTSKNPFAQVQATYGSFNTSKKSLKGSTGLLNNHFEFNGRYSQIQSDGYIDRATSDLKSYYVSGAYKDHKNTLKAIAFGGHEITYQAWYGVEKEKFENNPTFNYAGAVYDSVGNITDYYENQVDNYKQDHYQLHYKRNIGDNLYINLTGHYTYGRGYYEQYKQDEDFTEYGFTPYNLNGQIIETTDLIRRKWLDNDFYGIIATAHYQSIRSKIIAGLAFNEYDGKHFGRILWTEQALNVPYMKEYYFNKGIKKTTSGFVKAIYNISEKLRLFTDVQFRKIKYDLNGNLDWQTPFGLQDNLLFVNPKIGLYYKHNLQNQMYVSLAQTHREPNRKDYINNPDNKPQPETLNDVEAGWKYENEHLKTEINLYGMFYKNQLVLTGKLDQVGSPVRENIGQSYRIGTELQAGYMFSKFIQTSVNISLSNNRNIDYKVMENGTIANYGNTQLTYSPRLIGAALIELKPLKNLKIKIAEKYVGAQYMDNRNIEASKLEAYAVTNMFVSYTIKSFRPLKSIDMNIKLNNLLNKKYASNGYMWGDTPYYYPQAGFNFLAGLQLNF